jgi:thymidylate kinase
MTTEVSVAIARDEPGREPYPLGLIVRLFEALNDQEISYCHWKSNWHLDRSLRGLTDLDLLVERSESLRFRELLCQHGYKLMVSPPLKQYPAMEDYLGYDRESGLLVHLHVHYQLILGEQSVKNCRLPLERGFLESSHTYAGVHIPSPELETIVLTIRALLKYRARQFLKSMLSARRGRMPAHVLNEFEFLLDQTTVESISGVLESQVGFISRDVVLESLSAIRAKPQSGYALYRMRRRLRRELAPFQRYSRSQALIRYVRAEWASRRRLPFERSTTRKKTMAEGGTRIAVVGADGAGKSTVVGELTRWLSWRLTVPTYYMGSKQSSRVTKLAGWGTRIFGYPYRRSRTLIGENNVVSKLLCGLQSLFQSLHRIGIARDRYGRYVAGRRYASQGALVVYDRYPLEAVRIADRFMDGPQIASMHQNRMGPVVAALSRIEEDIYRRIRPPDHLFVLQVSPEVSSQRKPDHKPEILEVKSQALNEMERDGLRITEIDADQPLDRVLLEVKTRLWDLL